MKTILITGLAMIVPALAQTPEDLTLQFVKRVKVYQLQLNPRVTPGVYLGVGATVKNAPYSADAATEMTQSLTDGNRIAQRTTQKLYRDSDGRERREGSVLAVGALAQPDAPLVITISDPIENISYTLDPQQHTARRTTGVGVWFPLLNAISAGGLRYAATPSGTYVDWTAGRGSVQAPGGATRVKEDLGSRNIEGVIAQGTRTTDTIPAGQIGNQLPIKVVDEVWRSPELQMDVMTTHSDPRTGEIVYKLTNINRANPPRTLFEPPADYTISGPAAGGAGGRGTGVSDPSPGGRGGRGGAAGRQK
jgi:hypothetical protein